MDPLNFSPIEEQFVHKYTNAEFSLSIMCCISSVNSSDSVLAGGLVEGTVDL